ncbi:terpene synthase family protein [Saccharothrix deserti]|uniref:terpene synthase family protein n=1 Tax=Saccharothrix deserti TaxID=2593674 RepID=UPI00131EA9E6|nr:hypothetical protein [Saccharothrix deserti]
MTTIDAPIRLRPFYCPIDAAIHPRVAEAERQAVNWIDRIGICASDRDRKRLLGTNSAEFYARFAPYACEEGLQTAARWVYWGFIFDDTQCDAGSLSGDPHTFLAMAGTVQRALETPWHEVVDDRFALSLQDIGRSMRRCATPVQVRRFAEAHRAWLYAVAWQVANRSRDHMPDLSDYTTMRLNSAGGAPTIALLEIANGEEVPGAEMDSPAVRALTEMTILVASWDNDLHSYAKEVREQHTDQSLVTVLAHHRRLTPDQAVDEALALRDRVMTRFLRLRERVAARPCSDALRVYLDCLGHAIRGNIDWAINVPRYHGMPHPGWADAPSDTNPAPLPIPAIAWWWDDL